MKHIVVHDDDLRLECLSCHAVERPEHLPLEVTLYVKWARLFESAHRQCACKCKLNDAWRCAREKGRTDVAYKGQRRVACPCECHVVDRYVS